MSIGEKFHIMDGWYPLRPEVVESLFVMWRLTHDQTYREWGYEIAQNIEKHCKLEHGYSGLKDAQTLEYSDQQESFFLAETLKYLYLLFSNDDLISLDDYVFTTEGHPLRKQS